MRVPLQLHIAWLRTGRTPSADSTFNSEYIARPLRARTQATIRNGGKQLQDEFEATVKLLAHVGDHSTPKAASNSSPHR